MKKIITVFLTIVIASTSFFVPTVVRAKTLGDLQSELEAKQSEYNQNEAKKNMTQAQINQTRNEIVGIKSSISQTHIDITNLNKEIEQLNKDIEAKNKEIKQIVNYVQLSNGESAYLEYAFGAKDFTDFIYRLAVAEQLTNYNDKLIAEYNNSINESKKKQEEIKQKQINLADQQKSLESKAALLGEEVKSLSSTGISIEDSIKYQKEVIDGYIKMGCKSNEDINACGRKMLPQGTAFFRPTNSGKITSEWGPRNLFGDRHEGIDVGVGVGTPVYPIATGRVKAIIRYSCGGNMIVIHHVVNGKTYTSVYAHLSNIVIGTEQNVTKNDIIGYSGGAIGGYDQCTLGPHLHVTVTERWYLVDYTDWPKDTSSRILTINPRTVINFPSYGVSWTDRITAY